MSTLNHDTELELREKLATIEHERWADWQKWCHEVLRENCPSQELEMVIQRWDRQIDTPYAELTLAEKASDMEQVDRYWPLINTYLYEQTLELIPADFPNPPLGDFWNVGQNQLKAQLRKAAAERWGQE